jgi:hypothetical protein
MDDTALTLRLRSIVQAENLDEYVDGYQANMSDVSLRALDHHVQPFRHLRGLRVNYLEGHNFEHDVVVFLKGVQFLLVVSPIFQRRLGFVY